MGKDQFLQQIGLGAAAGLAGTAAMHAVRTAHQKFAPEMTTPVRQDSTESMGNLVEQPSAARSTASALLSFGYGSSAAALYSALREEPKVLIDGAALGLALWSIGYLGWFPALKLAPDGRRQTKTQLAMSMAQHLLYGIVSVAAYRRVKRALA